MNGLIQHLATSGIDLSEDNIIACVCSNTNVFETGDYVVDIPDKYYMFTFGGILNTSSGGVTNNTWGYAIFEINRIARTSALLTQYSHDNDEGYSMSFEIWSDGYLSIKTLRPTGGSAASKTSPMPRIYLKSI